MQISVWTNRTTCHKYEWTMSHNNTIVLCLYSSTSTEYVCNAHMTMVDCSGLTPPSISVLCTYFYYFTFVQKAFTDCHAISQERDARIICVSVVHSYPRLRFHFRLSMLAHIKYILYDMSRRMQTINRMGLDGHKLVQHVIINLQSCSSIIITNITNYRERGRESEADGDPLITLDSVLHSMVVSMHHRSIAL